MASQFDNQPLDHGWMQLPLAKRQGNIDAQIDAHKATQARELKAAQAKSRALVAEARAAVRALSMERLAQLGKPHGMSAKQTLAMMLSAAASRPAHTIRALSKEA
jgi:hypothetical protein